MQWGRDDNSLADEQFSLGPDVTIVKDTISEMSKGSTGTLYPVLNGPTLSRNPDHFVRVPSSPYYLPFHQHFCVVGRFHQERFYITSRPLMKLLNNDGSTTDIPSIIIFKTCHLSSPFNMCFIDGAQY